MTDAMPPLTPAAGPIRIAVIGYGKIAADSHVPAIRANPDFELVAVVSVHGKGPAGVPLFRTVDELLASGLALDATSHCNIPRARLDTALATIGADLATMLEKPPAATLGEAQLLVDAAQGSKAVVMTAWHSRANAAVARARDWLSDKRIERVRIDWHEDVRKWHPGQDWIWQPGGFGVFDPGINALSIATAILPFAPFVKAAKLVTPANRAMPIAADIDFAARGWDGAMSASFDWRVTGDECWQIAVDTDAGQLLLDGGGSQLSVGGARLLAHANDEYPQLYRDFAHCIRSGASDLDISPLRLVADAFLLGERVEAAAFD